MNDQERDGLKQKIIEEIKNQKHLIKSFEETSKPVAPDNAIGRLTRMEAISSQKISGATLNFAKVSWQGLKKRSKKLICCNLVFVHLVLILYRRNESC